MADYVIGIDPSGNWEQGKGTTGWCVVDKAGQLVEFGSLHAQSAECAMEYFDNHIRLLSVLAQKYPNSVLSIEDYILYADKATQQINSKFETPQLLGVIKYWAWQNGLPLYIRTASVAKKRWTDEILEHKGLITKNGSRWFSQGVSTCDHERDAMRHALHCLNFELKGDE